MPITRFAARLKELREAAGLTQRGIAEKGGIPYAAVRDLEQGLYSPKWETVLALAAALGVDCRAFQEEPAASPETPKRGRPAKAPSEDRAASPPAPKKRGRPKKGEG